MARVAWWNVALEALARDPLLAPLCAQARERGLEANADLLATYVRAVCGQQVSTAAAEKTARKVLAFAGEDAPAAVLASASIQELADLGLSAAKAQAISWLAQGYLLGPLTREALAPLTDTAVRARLTALKGIGPWTADMVLIFGLNRPDVWAASDYGLRSAVAAKGLTMDIGNRFAPWRTAAGWLLWNERSRAPVQY